jgi:hypothetical protein
VSAVILVDEHEGKTKRGTPFKMQVWQNHHGAFEGHVFLAQDANIFSSYDQVARKVAEKLAIRRAESASH